MKPKGYRWAIMWMAENDDCSWVQDPSPIPSVVASLVADLYGVTTGQVTDALRRYYEAAAKAQRGLHT